MSLVNRLSRAEKVVGRLGGGRPKDLIYPYEITSDEFEHMARNSVCLFGPPPDRNDMLRQFTKDQVDDVWRRHYHYYRDGRLVDPPPEHIQYIDKLTNMTLQDWYEEQMKYIIQFPHRVCFDLAAFGLETWEDIIDSIPYLRYDPLC